MPLINCPECNKEISNKAASCPNCGYPINSLKLSIEQKPSTPKVATYPQEKLLKCPKCRSTQVSAHKKGFSGGKAVAGAVLTGGIGLLAGTIGSNDVKITCLNCGHVFNPGDKPIEPVKTSETGLILTLVSIAIFIGGGIFLLIKIIQIFNN